MPATALCKPALLRKVLRTTYSHPSLYPIQQQFGSFSPTAAAMLGRAVSQYHPPAKREPAKQQLFTPSASATSSSSTPTIDESLKKKKTMQSSQQSLGDYANPARKASALRSLSPNTHTSKPRSTAVPARTHSSAAQGLASVLQRSGSFQDAPIDLTIDSAPKPRFDDFDTGDWMDDFPDDEDIDLDADEPSLNLGRFRHKPSPLGKPEPTMSLPKLPTPSRHQNISSSAVTWSSSSPSHKVTPAKAKRQYRIPEVPSEDPIDANPRPAKRRTLPWTARKTEDEIAERDIAEAAASGEFTPLPKDTKSKQFPWNTSASAVKDQQKQWKNQRKQMLTKTSDMTNEEMADAADTRTKSNKKAGYHPITLNEEQNKILELVVEKKKSVFFTGSAGTGKSVLMRSIIEKLKKKYAKDPERVWVTASTGLAACNIGGQTLHSFGGIGLGKEDVQTLVKKIKRNAKSKNRWIKCQVLIIDEISMVDGELFDKLEGIARIIKNNGRPFGGIQLVITGDFFQLPPVPEQGKGGVKFAFEAATWNTAIDHTIGLSQVFRQKDPVFANMLNEMRLGRISDESVRIFKGLSRPIAGDVTELFPTRNEVENSNAMRMRQLSGDSRVYEANDKGGTADPTTKEKLLANMMAPKSITLKKGAQVMLIKNVDDSLVNGSLGHVVGFMSEKTFELYDHDPEAFEEGYEDEEGLSSKERAARQKMKEKISGLKHEAKASGQLLPLVKFQISDGTSRDMLVQYDDWKVELPSGEILAQRSQLPLILAWALSIHKAQGQTLEHVKVDLGKVFEKGQAYVALSRATSQEGLQVLRFDKSKVMAHPKVIKFYRELYAVDQVGKKTVAPTSTTTSSTSTAVAKAKSGPVQNGMKKVVQQQQYADFDDEEEEIMRMGGWD